MINERDVILSAYSFAIMFVLKSLRLITLVKVILFPVVTPGSHRVNTHCNFNT